MERGHIASAVSELLSAGVVEGSVAWVTCNPHLVSKKDGRIRMCIDYRPINEVIESFNWPMPRIQDLRHRVPAGQVFTRLDLRNAFFHVHVPESLRPLTAFQTHLGKFQYTRMPFGLKTAPSVFQRFMDWLLLPFQRGVIGYQDDILLFAPNTRTLRQLTQGVFRRLAEEQVDVNTEKCEFERTSIEFVGLGFGPEGLAPSTKILELDSWPVPRTKADRLSFLGFSGYFRDFIPGYSEIAAPLYEDRLPQETYALAFRALLRQAEKWITLSHYRDDKEAILFTDASNRASGAVLVQEGKVIAVHSKKFSAAQARYSTTDRETLALVNGLVAFRLFVQTNHRITTRTDHTALLNRRVHDLTPLQARWVTKIKWLAPRLEYEPGKSNPADYFSRQGGEGGWTGPIFKDSHSPL